ncbi:MAG TPA: rhodanese-like domain-containing protein [Polyangiaceae bacterium]
MSRSGTQAVGAPGKNASRAREKVIEKMLPAVLSVVLLLAVGYFTLMKGGDVNSAQAHQLVQAGARLVDVRTPSEFAAGHIPGAVNIPLQQLDSRQSELQPPHTPVILYCRSGNRSRSATRVLKNAGFAAVHDLGAMSRW